MNTLDKLYLDYLEGRISAQEYHKMVEAYERIPQVERERNGI